MREPSELRAQIRTTESFISANPSELTLIPQVRTKTPTGAWVTSPGTPRAAQTIRIIDLSGSQSANTPLQKTADGVERAVNFMLLGMPDAIIGLHDMWIEGSHRWEVTQLLPDNGYERRALAAEHG